MVLLYLDFKFKTVWGVPEVIAFVLACLWVLLEIVSNLDNTPGVGIWRDAGGLGHFGLLHCSVG